MRFKPKYVFLDLVPYYCCTVAQQKAMCTPYVGELGFKRCKVEVEVAQTFDQKRHSATYELWVWFKKQGSRYVLPACCDIDRAYPSLMQQRTKL